MKSPNRMNIPTICARSINLSLGLRPVITSISRKSTCPPSSAGIGRIFIKARMSESIAVIFQKRYQFQAGGNILPIVPNIPTDFAPSAEARYLKSLTYPLRTLQPYSIPAGNDSMKPYSLVIVG